MASFYYYNSFPPGNVIIFENQQKKEQGIHSLSGEILKTDTL